MSDCRQIAIELSDKLGLMTQTNQNKAESLVQYYNRKGYLTDPQIKFAGILLDMTKPKDPIPTAIVANFGKIIEVFDYAKANGNKKHKLRFGTKDITVVVSLAPSTGANAGMIYVKLNDEYQGKITREGLFQGQGSKNTELMQILTNFSINPAKMAKEYGFRTGSCSCCGRMLTDPISIANGVGPICAEGWGF